VIKMMEEIINDIYNSMSFFVIQTLSFLVKLLVAYVIWLLGNYLIGFIENAVSTLDVKEWKLDDYVRRTLLKIGRPLAKVVLFLVVLDYLGIGDSVISALTQGLTFMVAIALGIAFGDALRPEARKLVEEFKQETDIRA
jgi:hypothetical protein